MDIQKDCAPLEYSFNKGKLLLCVAKVIPLSGGCSTDGGGKLLLCVTKVNTFVWGMLH